MQSPGSNPGIPEQAEIEFKEQWNRAKPGTKHKIGFLQLRDGGRLAVFPHREWDPPVEQARLCVLFPVRNAAVAAPVGGIPEDERGEEEQSPAPRHSRHRDATRSLVVEEAAEPAPRRLAPPPFLAPFLPRPLHEDELLAERRPVLVAHPFGGGTATLAGGVGVVEPAVEAAAQVGVARGAALAEARLAAAVPLGAAMVAALHGTGSVRGRLSPIPRPPRAELPARW